MQIFLSDKFIRQSFQLLYSGICLMVLNNASMHRLENILFFPITFRISNSCLTMFRQRMYGATPAGKKIFCNKQLAKIILAFSFIPGVPGIFYTTMLLPSGKH